VTSNRDALWTRIDEALAEETESVEVERRREPDAASGGDLARGQGDARRRPLFDPEELGLEK
jgi:hypothetical protein